jgi:uncharacterized membrane protein YoaK (UPF0700 family)
MIKTILQSAAIRERTRTADWQLGVMLAFIAGAINAGGFLAVGRYTSHMTGIVSSIGDSLALHQLYAALYALLYLLSFVTGAITCSLIVNAMRMRDYHSEFGIVLLLEASLLFIFGVSAVGVFQLTLSIEQIVALLCFIMGLQNAIISKISRSVIRTTHVTGISTDIGIELGRYLFSRFHRNAPVTANAGRLKILLSLLASFLTGSIVGAFAFYYLGFATTIPLVILLLALAAEPLRRDLHAFYRQQR